MSVGLKGNADGSGAIQVGGTDAITLSTALDTTLAGSLSAPNTFGFKNRLINGDMDIDQRNNGASVTQTTADLFPTDRWNISGSVTSKFTAQQNAGSVTPPAGFTNYLGMTSLSAYTVGSSETFYVRQKIEGLNVSDLAWGTANAATVTLSFWARSSLTGTFGGSLSNSSINRVYPFSYTISSANTWEKKTVTIAGDTSGTWLTTNGIGIGVYFSLGSGATYSAAAGSWTGSTVFSATGATSVVGTNGATFYITGVQLEKGRVATSFDVRPYGTELALCQRYYYRQYSSATGSRFGMGQVLSSTSALVNSLFPVTMRTAPTALEQTGTAANYLITNNAGTGVACSAVPTFNIANVSEANTLFTVASGLTAGNACFCPASAANIYLGWSAEL
jgi:hypothetical protein